MWDIRPPSDDVLIGGWVPQLTIMTPLPEPPLVLAWFQVWGQ